uniref:Inner centromere protein n=1 Tax=Chelonoidis abingdonii TaxID=106734 RepID=A0A8C0JE56_CHEAB
EHGGGVGPAHYRVCNRKLAEFLRQVRHRHGLAAEIARSCSDEPQLMPKTPSQKNRPKRQLSSVQDENKDPIRKRLSRRSIKRASAKRYSRRLRSKEDLEIIRAVMEEASPPRRVTRSRAVVSDMHSMALPEKSAVQPVEGRVPLVDISVNDRNSAELHLKRNLPKTGAMVSKVIVLSSDDDSPKKTGMVELQPMSAASVLLIPETTKPKGAREGRSASKLKIANTATSKATVNREPATAEMDVSAQGPEGNQGSVKELSQDLKDGTGTPTGSKSSRHSVRRSLMCRTSMICRTSLAEKYSLASKRESMIRKSVSRARSKRIAARQSSLASKREFLRFTRQFCFAPFPGTLRQSSPLPRPEAAGAEAGSPSAPLPEVGSSSGSPSLPPTYTICVNFCRRKPSYKKAVDELYDGQQAEEGGLSPPRKKTPSPLCPASKVVRPFKTFLHTVQKNQLLMTPCSVGRSSIKKSFIKHNTPLRTDPKEKERQRLESLRRKQEAEQQRKQKLEEEKRQRLEEMKLKREARLRKVLQARERVEQMEEEKKRRIEQKLAQFDEKSEKVSGLNLTMEPLETMVFLWEWVGWRRGHLTFGHVLSCIGAKGTDINSPICNSYQMTPQGPKGPKPPTINPNNYGMDLNSDDSTDDESQPRKPIPAWANGTQLSQAVIHQYYNPPDITTLFGAIISPKLENIFYKNKPRYFKRTSSAVWNSPPFPGAKAVLGLPYSLKKY